MEFGHDTKGVIAEDGHGIGYLRTAVGIAIFGAVGLDERLHLRAGIVGGIVIGEIAAVGNGAEVPIGLWIIPAVAAEKGNGHSQLARLAEHLADFCVITGHKNGLHIGIFDVGELAFEIVVAFAIALFDGHLPPVFR